MKLKEREVVKITYVKDDGVSERTIIPTSLPNVNIKALDVTDLSPSEVETMTARYTEYVEYLQQMSKTIFNFEDWVSHTHNESISPKWRTFKSDKIEVI